MTELRLETGDPDVWQRTLRAAESRIGTKVIKVRCQEGGCELAQLAVTDLGPLFQSSFEAERPARFAATVNGHRLSGAERKAYDRLWPIVEQSGRPIEEVERHGSVALLVVPEDMVQDYPDLLVRCQHGDAVVDRLEAVEWTRRGGRAPKVQVGFPRLTYMRPRNPGSTTSRPREVRRWEPPKDA
jgi:hypothetical protein